MRFLLVPLTAAAVAFSTVAAFGQRTQEEYEQQRDSLPYAERFDHAETALGHANDEIVVQALTDLLDTAKQLGKNQDAIAVLDQYLTQVPESSSLHQHAFYVRARLLHRVPDQQETAVALFKQGITNGWKPLDRETGFAAYKDSLWENDPALYAIEVFNDVVADTTGEAYVKRGDHLVSLGVDLLWPLRKNNKGRKKLSAVEGIAPRLSGGTEGWAHVQIASALCLLIDERYDEAVEALLEVDGNLAYPPAGYDYSDFQQSITYNEKLNIPLYLATVRLFEGDRVEEAWTHMNMFLALNSARPHYVSRKLMTIVYALQKVSFEEQRRMTEVTGFLMDNGLHVDPRLPEGHRLHVLDMHAGGHFRQGNWKQAEETAKLVVGDYDPCQEACNNSLFVLGCAYRMQERQEEAEETFLLLESTATTEKWERVAEAQLIHLRITLKRPVEEIRPLAENLNKASPEEQSYYYHSQALRRLEWYESQNR